MELRFIRHRVRLMDRSDVKESLMRLLQDKSKYSAAKGEAADTTETVPDSADRIHGSDTIESRTDEFTSAEEDNAFADNAFADDDGDAGEIVHAVDAVDVLFRRQLTQRTQELGVIRQNLRVRTILASQFRSNLEENATVSQMGSAPHPPAQASRPPMMAQELLQLQSGSRVSTLLGSIFRQDLERALDHPTPQRRVGQQLPPVLPAVSEAVRLSLQPPLLQYQQQPLFTPPLGALNVRRTERLVGTHAAAQHWQQTVQADIEELAHSRFVSRVLEGDFRPILEFHFRERGVHIGGQPAQPARRRAEGVPSSTFFAGPTQESVTNQRSEVVGSRGMLRLQERMDVIAGHVSELHRFLRLTFDLQLDIQRSIRQEVAAAITGTHHRESQALSQPLARGGCLICLDMEADTLLYRCGHICACYLCARDLKARGQHCPVCRAPIDDVVRAYVQTVTPP